MNNYQIPTSEKYINPNRVDTKRALTIFSNDPRNNLDFLKKNPFTTIIDYVPEDIEQQNIDNLKNESITNPSPLDFSTSIFDDLNPDTSYSEGPVLSVPQNIIISNYELRYSNDGTIYYVATVYFDDALGADSYEYVLEIVQ
ncbi:MAG: hypothetical protein EB127_03270 [Alphaproteobacteria bacterium]|nr:hypothetical protein [Alphaproteobacteria bacterium]